MFADKQSVRVEALRGDRAAIEFRGMPPSARDQLVKEAGEGQRRPGQRLELRQHPHAQPEEEAVRRRARAQGRWHLPSTSGRAHRRWPRSPTSGPWAASSSPARRSPPPRRSCSRSRASGRTSRSRAPRPGVCLKEAGAEGLKFELLNRNVDQPYKYVGTWAVGRVEEDRPQRRAEGCANRPVVLQHARRHVRRGDGGQLPERGQSGARYRQVPAAYGLSGQLRRLRGSQVDRVVREDGARERSCGAARRYAGFEKYAMDTRCTRSCCLVVPHHPALRPT